jgi:formylglycine-generating enzyme required for sulfatase activity
LETCYIRGGHVNELSSGIPNKGGGLYVDGGTVVACIIRGNVANNVANHVTNPALGGGAYLTNGGKIYNSLVTNNMANDGYGVSGESGNTVTNVTIVYNTFAPVSVLVPGTGPNIAENVTYTANYYLHQAHNTNATAPATYTDVVKVQLTDFYLGATETTSLQYCVFLAGIDYTWSLDIVRLANNYRDSLWTLKVYNTGKTGEPGYKTVREYYGTTVVGSSQSDEQYCTNNGYQLCGAINSNTYFGYLLLVDSIVVPKELTNGGTIPDDDISVCYVSWYGSMAYSQWLGGSLPTEAQWEFALRRKSSENFQAPTAGVTVANQSASLYNEAYAYAGYVSEAAAGSVILGYAWYTDNSSDVATAATYGVSTTHNHKVGEKKSNGLGLYDMNGNLWEWCADLYRSTTYALSDYAGNDGSDGSGIVVNPINNTVAGANSPPSRIYRGGYWSNAARNLRAGYRNGNYAGNRNSNLGFRPVFLLPFAP